MNHRQRTRIAVLFGGPSTEHDVSCSSAAGIITHLDRSRYQVQPVRISRDRRWAIGPVDTPEGVYTPDDLLRLTPAPALTRPVTDLMSASAALACADVVFPALHGPYGEDGTVQALLEVLRVPYVGSGIAASAAAMDKDVTKRLLAADQLPVVPWALLKHPACTLEKADRERLGLPVFVKPARSGSSIGVTRVDDWDSLPAALSRARRADPKVLVEKAVIGREIDIAVLQQPDGSLTAGPPLEIQVRGHQQFFDFDAKYRDNTTRFAIPAPLDDTLTHRLQSLALTAFDSLGCFGLARVDFLLDQTEPLINEVNTLPGFTEASQYPQIWAATQLPYPKLLDTLITSALGRPAPSRAAA
ncbi:D-alanine--D-alanine ligase [Streptomyces spinoverrucosus]|uniref:D-alanine--D-alanine ligase n=1 Tax=Streptomyces spinoverrucosus TaxID=284043 RepID=A0A4Y3VTB4_9ACTN|nr:D-alanine--D-alanine ligase family protein [Streptomyces spinoverrucosus]GEC10224.1 D-alanine--D-alanine ligase [Streptomyces spinoverrucosus]GHB96367.1 D-alanine--D-alanine ligase [Streptomyces spinoverrucosus]